MNNFYNTIGLSGTELDKAENQAASQEEIIYDFFCRHPQIFFTPADVCRYLNLPAPITSIRRAITNLTNKQKLQKTEVQKPGQYGKPNYCWKIADPQLALPIF